MKRYADVKQHILRYHSLNSFYYCSSCWEVWTKERPWQAHVQLRACTNILGPEHLLDEEADRLRTLETPRGLDDTRKWYCMWDELFRGHTRPVSPHVEDGIAEPAALLCRNGEAALRVDMPSLLRRYNITLDPEAMSWLVRSIVHTFSRACQAPPRRYRRYPEPEEVGARAGAGDTSELRTDQRSFDINDPPLSHMALDEAPPPPNAPDTLPVHLHSMLASDGHTPMQPEMPHVQQDQETVQTRADLATGVYLEREDESIIFWGSDGFDATGPQYVGSPGDVLDFSSELDGSGPFIVGPCLEDAIARLPASEDDLQIPQITSSRASLPVRPTIAPTAASGRSAP